MSQSSAALGLVVRELGDPVRSSPEAAGALAASPLVGGPRALAAADATAAAEADGAKPDEELEYVVCGRESLTSSWALPCRADVAVVRRACSGGGAL